MHRIPVPRIVRNPLWWLALAIVAVGVACTSDKAADVTATPTDAPTDVPTAAPEPQVLRLRLSGEPSTLDPQRAIDSASISVIRSLQASLLRIDENQLLQPDLAAEVPTVENGGISEDGLTYTFHLRDGLAWSDGTPLVAQHFVDGAHRLFEPGSGNLYADFYRMIAAGGAQAELGQARGEGLEGDALIEYEQAVADNIEVSAPDDQTVVYHLTERSPVFLLLTSLWPLSPARVDLVDAYGEAWTEPGTMVSSGPFVLASWDHGARLSLEPNSHWYGDGPALDEVQLEIIGDASAAFLAYEADELDVTEIGPAELVQVRGTDLEDEFEAYAGLATVGLFFNFHTPVLQSLEVRQALAGAVDREEFAEIVNEGAVLAAYSYLPPGMAGYDLAAGQQFRNAVAQSQQLLADAGHADGEGVTITLLTANVESSLTRAEWVKGQWERNLGITVDLDVVEPSSFVDSLIAGEWDVLSASWTADYPDPQNWLPPFRTGGGLNIGGFENADFDALIDEAAVELDEGARIQLYREAQRILIDEVAFSPIFYARRNILVKPWVQGFVPSALDQDLPGDRFLSEVSISGRP